MTTPKIPKRARSDDADSFVHGAAEAPSHPAPALEGPKGGRTTVLRGGDLVRRTISVPPDVWDELRRRALAERRDTTDLIRDALKQYLGW